MAARNTVGSEGTCISVSNLSPHRAPSAAPISLQPLPSEPCMARLLILSVRRRRSRSLAKRRRFTHASFSGRKPILYASIIIFLVRPVSILRVYKYLIITAHSDWFRAMWCRAKYDLACSVSGCSRYRWRRNYTDGSDHYFRYRIATRVSLLFACSC